MMGQSSTGWATTLADLSLILFMITAADLANAELAESAAAAPAAIAVAEPVALYRPGGSAPPLKSWLATQPDDPRQQLTVVVRYRPADAGAMMAQALQLASAAERAGRPARIVAEPAARSETAVIIAYDANPDQVARKLQD